MAEEKRKTFNYQGFLKQTVNWKDLRFYQKSEVLYHLTYVFCKRYLSTYGDRTVDQMVQSAQEEIIHWKSAYADLKARALKSYYNQQEEISDLKEQILKLQQQI